MRGQNNGPLGGRAQERVGEEGGGDGNGKKRDREGERTPSAQKLMLPYYLKLKACSRFSRLLKCIYLV